MSSIRRFNAQACTAVGSFPVGWWRSAAWKQFKSQLPEWMSFQLENWQEEALAFNAKERKIRQELEQMVTEILPVGVGALSWITLQLEIRGWGRFHNRRQVASYTGLCPGIHNSNGRGREGRINRCGNTIVRYTLIEMVWRLIRWQPEYLVCCNLIGRPTRYEDERACGAIRFP